MWSSSQVKVLKHCCYTVLFVCRVQGSLVYKNGEPIVDDENNFPDGTEVTFNCIETIMGEKTTWKIVCEDGSWIGRSLNCGGWFYRVFQKYVNMNYRCGRVDGISNSLQQQYMHFQKSRA